MAKLPVARAKKSSHRQGCLSLHIPHKVWRCKPENRSRAPEHASNGRILQGALHRQGVGAGLARQGQEKYSALLRRYLAGGLPTELFVKNAPHLGAASQKKSSPLWTLNFWNFAQGVPRTPFAPLRATHGIRCASRQVAYLWRFAPNFLYGASRHMCFPGRFAPVLGGFPVPGGVGAELGGQLYSIFHHV